MRSKVTYDIIPRERVLIDFENTFDQVGPVGLLDLKQDSLLVRAVDQVLQHGLRDPVRGYWVLVRSLTHSTTLKSLEAFVKYISSSQQKGLAWTFYTLEEGSLEFYLSSLLQDIKTLQQNYVEQSLLRDQKLSQRVVEAISTLRAEAANIPLSMESSLLSEGPLNPPSLTSPVDSGVALVDSDNSTSEGEKNEEYCSRQSGVQELGTSLNTIVSTSSDNTLADNTMADRHNANIEESEPSTDNKAKGIIQSVSGVCRRRKKKKSESGKRVSFHQDSNDESDVPVTLREPCNLNKFYVEGRYSWGGESDSFFTKEQENFRQVKSEIYERKGLSSNINIFESELGIEADCESSTTTLDDTRLNIETVCEKLTSVVCQSLGLGRPQLAEREAPEGQEDPVRGREYERVVRNMGTDLTSDSEWSMDTPDQQRHRHPRQPGSQRSVTGQPNWPTRILHEAPSKTSLVNRFLRSIPTRKLYKDKKTSVRRSLYISGVKPDPGLTQQLLVELDREMKQMQTLDNNVQGKGEDESVTAAMDAALHDTVLMDKQEKIYKVYRVASTEGEPLLAVLTDTALYMTGLGLNQHYTRRHHICYQTLDTVVIGPEHQTVMLVTVDHSVTVTVISALGQALVTHMMTHLALAVYRKAHSHLSVCHLTLGTMHSLYQALLTHTSVSSDEQLHYYRYIRVEDSYISGPCGPLGPSKCGHLMYRPHNHSPWLPGYIVLRGGVLYVFSDVHQLTPRHVLSFHRGYFGGCRRVFNANRPHTFEVLPFSQSGLYGTFQFAAADDYESSDWLQAFIQTSATMSQSPDNEEPVVGCGLLLTSRHLLTLDFPDTVLSCIRLQDISTIRTATTCCVLETTCREVQQSGGDWILYFLNQQAITEFLASLYSLRPQLKQAVVNTWECDVLLSHCLQTSQLVTTAWDPLLRPSCIKRNT